MHRFEANHSHARRLGRAWRRAAVVALSLLGTSCSEPRCPDNKILIGKHCISRSRKADAGLDSTGGRDEGDDEQAARADAGKRRRDATVQEDDVDLQDDDVSFEEDASERADAQAAQSDLDAAAPDDSGKPVVSIPTAPTSCPPDSHITADNQRKVCVISAPASNPIKTDLALVPVPDFKGYVLNGVVYVGEDVGGEAAPAAGKARATLRITPGVTLAGQDITSALVINRGSKLDAQGTTAAPIVFTSLRDLLPGSVVPAPTDWGGVVLMGRATQNKGPNPVTEFDTGMYGGQDDADSSGTLRYVRVLYAGARASTEKKFNGISFYAAGSGTMVDYIQVHAGSDDGVEFFGGTVNVRHLVVSGHGDDAIDWTDGFRGKIQFVAVRQVANFGDNGIEADNNVALFTAEPVSAPIISNVTFIGHKSANGADGPNGLLLRRGTKATLSSFVMLDFRKSGINVDGSTGLINNGLSIASSRLWSEPLYAGNGEQLFTTGTGNSVLASKDVLNGWLPKSDSGLLAGGTVPAGDSFFGAAEYIGAFGTEDWTAGWTAYPDFTPQ